MKSQHGFSALEALIAAALLGVALAPLLDLQRQSFRAAARVEAAQAEVSAQGTALDLLTSVNVMAEPAGRRLISERFAMEWRARALTRVIPGVGYLAADGGFDTALYAVDVRVLDGAREVAAFQVEQIGWRRRVDGDERPSAREGR